jgi:hypothetical protein
LIGGIHLLILPFLPFEGLVDRPTTARFRREI